MGISISILQEAIKSLPPKPNFYFSVDRWRVVLPVKASPSINKENVPIKIPDLETLNFEFDHELDEWKLML